jgi:hypothetical protein
MSLQALRPADQQLGQLLVDRHGDGEIALFQVRVEVPVVARGDDHPQPIGLVFPPERLVFLLRKRFQRNKIDHLLAPQRGLDGRHLPHEGLARTRGRLNQQVPVLEEAVPFRGAFLQGQQTRALLLPPQRQHLRGNPVPKQFIHLHGRTPRTSPTPSTA